MIGRGTASPSHQAVESFTSATNTQPTVYILLLLIHHDKFSVGEDKNCFAKITALGKDFLYTVCIHLCNTHGNGLKETICKQKICAYNGGCT